MKWIKNVMLLWLARRIARTLAETVPGELESLDVRASKLPCWAVAPAITALQAIVDPARRTAEMSQSLKTLSEELSRRAKRHEGVLDDAAVLVVRGLLNTL